MCYKFSKKYDTAIVALWFKPEQIKKLKIKHKLDKDGVTDPEEFHVTMMYLGKLIDINKDKKIIEQCVEKLASKYDPFKLTLGGVAKFFTDKEKNPIVFTVNADEIESLRNDILNTMKSIGVNEQEDCPSFVPHMTLGFVDKDNDLNSINIKNDELLVDGICLSWGGNKKYFNFR